MATLVIQHAVADFAAWKQAFDADPLGRAKHGVLRHAVHRAADDPRFVVIQLEFASLEQADAFLGLLRSMWGRVGERIGFGGAGNVETRVLEEIERVEY